MESYKKQKTIVCQKQIKQTKQLLEIKINIIQNHLKEIIETYYEPAKREYKDYQTIGLNIIKTYYEPAKREYRDYQTIGLSLNDYIENQIIFELKNNSECLKLLIRTHIEKHIKLIKDAEVKAQEIYPQRNQNKQTQLAFATIKILYF